MVKVCAVNGYHLSGQLALNPALILPVPGKRLFLGEDEDEDEVEVEVECDRLSACVVEISGAAFGLPLTAFIYDKSV